MTEKMATFSLFILLTIVLTVVPVGGCAAPTPSPGPEPIRLTAISAFSSNDPTSAPIFWFIDKVNERAGGELTIEYVGGPEVIQEFSQYEAVSAGRIDIAINCPSYAPGVVPGGEAWNLSELTFDEEYATGARDYMNELHAKANLLLLANTEGAHQFWLCLHERVETVEDLVGLKVGDGTITPYGLAALGMILVTTPWLEIYTALERGVIDGMAMTLAPMASMGWYEAFDYILDIPWGTVDGALVMNLDKFNSLPQHLQELIRQAAREMEQEAIPFFEREDSEALELMVEEGIEVLEFSQEDTEYFVDTLYEAEWAAIIERYPDIGPKLKEFYCKKR